MHHTLQNPIGPKKILSASFQPTSPTREASDPVSCEGWWIPKAVGGLALSCCPCRAGCMVYFLLHLGEPCSKLLLAWWFPQGVVPSIVFGGCSSSMSLKLFWKPAMRGVLNSTQVYSGDDAMFLDKSRDMYISRDWPCQSLWRSSLVKAGTLLIRNFAVLICNYFQSCSQNEFWKIGSWSFTTHSNK